MEDEEVRDVQHARLDLPRDISGLVGRNLRNLRKERGYSLERLAHLAEVSRAMLGQIETGKSVPTIGLIWKVAAALNVPLAALVADPAVRPPTVIRRSAAPVLTLSDGRFTMRQIAPARDTRALAFYEIRIAAGHRERRPAEELAAPSVLTVGSGVLTVVIEPNDTYRLEEGDSIQFARDAGHSFEAGPDAPVTFYLLAIPPRA